MPAEFESGFFYREPAWHKQGVVVDHVLTAAEAIELIGDWTVITCPLFAEIEQGGVKTLYPVDGAFATVRTDTNAVLGIVGSRYHPVQNRDLFKFFDPVVDRETGTFYHTGGVLQGGKKIWILAKVPGDFYVPGVEDDLIENYVLLCSSHDGSLVVMAKHTPVRVVCANTLAMALHGGVAIKVKHTRNADRALLDAHRILGLATKRIVQVQEAAEVLNGIPITDKAIAGLFAKLFPLKDDKEEETTYVKNQKERLHMLFEADNNKLTGMQHTGWAAYNVVAEFVDHMLPAHANTDTLNRTWFGRGENIKRSAFAYVMKQEWENG